MTDLVSVIISPRTARRWLARNTQNGPRNPERVADFAAAILAGEWRPDDTSIRFVDGELVDGHHRLAAIVAADRSVRTNVVRTVT